MTTSPQMMTPAETPSGLSRISARHLIILSIAFGLFVSGYLSYLKLTSVPAACSESGVFNCGLVLNSIYSELYGIPIAYLGFIVYVFLGIIVLFENRIGILEEYGRILMFGIALFAWMFSMWLVYVQFFLLETLCPWCLSHEANFTILFGFIIYRLWQEFKPASEKQK